MPPSAMSGTRSADRQPALDERLHLRHAEVRRQARRAAAARADADLDAVDAALEQEPRAFGGGDVAGDQLDAAEPLARTASIARSITTEWPCAMSMTSTSTPALSSSAGALEVVAGRADRRADAQPALLVARRERMPPLLEQILAR